MKLYLSSSVCLYVFIVPTSNWRDGFYTIDLDKSEAYYNSLRRLNLCFTSRQKDPLEIHTFRMIFVTSIRLKVMLTLVMTQHVDLSLHSHFPNVNGSKDKAMSCMSHYRADRMLSHPSSLLNPTSRHPELLMTPAPTTGAFEEIEGKSGLMSLASRSWDVYSCPTHQAPVRKCLAGTQTHKHVQTHLH